MKISWRHRERRRARSFAITESAVASETMSLIENFSGKGIIRQILGCGVVDENEENCQNRETAHKPGPYVLKELLIGDGNVHK